MRQWCSDHLHSSLEAERVNEIFLQTAESLRMPLVSGRENSLDSGRENFILNSSKFPGFETLVTKDIRSNSYGNYLSIEYFSNIIPLRVKKLNKWECASVRNIDYKFFWYSACCFFQLEPVSTAQLICWQNQIQSESCLIFQWSNRMDILNDLVTLDMPMVSYNINWAIRQTAVNRISMKSTSPQRTCNS